MIEPILPLTRRGLLTGLGGTLLVAGATSRAHAQGRATMTLQAKPATIALRPGAADTPIWSLQATSPAAPLRFKRGDELEVTLDNGLPDAVVLNWFGLDGAPATEPLLARPPVAAGGKDIFRLALRHAGTFMCDVRLLGDAGSQPLSACPIIISENDPVAVDRDEVLVIEDWRLRPDGSAIAAGVDARDAVPIYTVNGRADLDLSARVNDRLRLRFINACHRNAIAVKIDIESVRVMAIDGQPCEPFLARDGQLVLAPGTRIDVFIDAARPPGSISTIRLHDGKQAHPLARLLTSGDAPVRDTPLPGPEPLPSNGLPAQLDLKNAMRFEVPLGPAQTVPGWISPAQLSGAAPPAPAFRARLGRTVVLALINRGPAPVVFHLHGHHARLLDRLDDGWKPFWLDTLMIDAGTTQRIAFAAEHAGRWLLEATAADWAAPRLLRWYEVS